MMFNIIAMLTVIMMIVIIKRAKLFSHRKALMRLTSEQAKENRQTILETASRMFRLHGMENVSVADIMKESGFTHGGFYNHFSSKEELAAKAVACAFEQTVHRLSEKFISGRSPEKSFERLITEYLSTEYRDSSTGGCPASALPVDSARSGKEVQRAFADGVESYLDLFAARMDGNRQEARQQAIALLSGLVGALMLSRAMKKSDPKLSDELLRSARKQLYK
jgi:TetR/AcrR family transcriptional regulator, transcriptional repressor for nem operon